jgi:glutamate synthase (NADPH/NADH) small chain
MDCGVPFCHSDYGCPVDNLIPEWNDLVYHGRYKDAWLRL